MEKAMEMQFEKLKLALAEDLRDFLKSFDHNDQISVLNDLPEDLELRAAEAVIAVIGAAQQATDKANEEE